MRKISLKQRRWIAVAIWFLGLSVTALLGLWNLANSQREADSRLIGEAARAAGELSGLLALSEWAIDEQAARAAVSGAMEDERIYAVKITLDQRTLEGQRRNYLWEPIPWDDEITENSVQGMNPIIIDGQNIGRVEVWISTRGVKEEYALLARREALRWSLTAVLWTAALFLLLWYWGDARRLIHRFRQELSASDSPEKVVLGLSPRIQQETEKEAPPVCAIDGTAARAYLRQNTEAWLVTAGLFRQAFARGPMLINRLYAEGDTAGLCHLAKILVIAAPCIGATRLKTAAENMRNAFNDPDCNIRAMAVEECSRALEEVLGTTKREPSQDG